MDPILERYQALEDKVKAYNPALDAKRLFSAFTYADNAHAGQLRKDGSPRKRFVQVGPQSNDQVVILDGVTEGQEVVLP